jgi:pimeloyl-ACP methyl ester carboxylesterase
LDATNGVLYLPWDQLPPSTTFGTTFYFPSFAVPTLQTVDHYFASQTPYLRVRDAGLPLSYLGPAPLPGSPTFSPTNDSPLLIASIGESLTVSGWAKQRITNGTYTNRFGYLEQYFDKAWHVEDNGLVTTDEAGLLSPYGEFLPTRSGVAVLATLPDIDTGQQGTGAVRVISIDVDANHDGTMDSSYSGPDFTCPAHPFRFWVNDNRDEGEDGGNGIPGQGPLGDGQRKIKIGDGMAIDGTPFFRWVDQAHGVRDLVDWFPIHINIGSLFQSTPYGPSTSVSDTNCHFRLRQADGALRFLYTGLTPTNYMDFLRDTNVARSLAESRPTTITADGIDLTNTFVQAIANGGGILLAEAWTNTAQPLVLEVWQGTRLLAQTRLHLSSSGVEQMFRHKNLMPSGVGPADRVGGSSVWNEPDTSDKAFVFVHGYNVNPMQARGNASDIFKRLYWAGSHARFYAVTWNGAVSQGDVPLPRGGSANFPTGITPNYHTNVANAFLAAESLSDFLKSLTNGPVTLAAHSLGNMVSLSAISDHGARPSNFFMVDAAVPIEAIDGSLMNSGMIPLPWRDYTNGLYAANWYNLFTNTDFRSILKWNNRFPNLEGVQLYNFYSSGEEVLREFSEDPPTNILSALAAIVEDAIFLQSPKASFMWVWQEKAKGLAASDSLLGSTHGGWKFNGAYTNMGVAQAALLPPEQLRTNALFDFGSQSFPSDLALEEALGNLYAAYHHNRIIADAIPALSWSVGSHSVTNLDVRFGESRNFDMQALYENGWPTNRAPRLVGAAASGEWHHSDIREPAYTFTCPLFNKFTQSGDLK